MQPGDLLKPNNSNDDSVAKQNESVVSPASPITSVPQSMPKQEQPEHYSQASAVVPMPTNTMPYAPSVNPPIGEEGLAGDDAVTWEAAEFIAHDKTPFWYVGLGFAAAVLGALLFLITKDVITVAAITLAIVAFGIIGSRRPRTIEYRIDARGVSVGEKFYPYSAFKSYSLSGMGAVGAVDLLPLHRFKPLVSMHFTEQQAEEVLNALGDHLPFEQRNMDPIDRLMHRLRF